ncbi:hypothetical protein ABZ035_30640, partial [Streptomyces sp. NPDC006334]
LGWSNLDFITQTGRFAPAQNITFPVRNRLRTGPRRKLACPSRPRSHSGVTYASTGVKSHPRTFHALPAS